MSQIRSGKITNRERESYVERRYLAQRRVKDRTEERKRKRERNKDIKNNILFLVLRTKLGISL